MWSVQVAWDGWRWRGNGEKFRVGWDENIAWEKDLRETQAGKTTTRQTCSPPPSSSSPLLHFLPFVSTLSVDALRSKPLIRL